MNIGYDLARVTTATIGTGTITLGSAVLGYLTFAQAGVPTGARVSYGISDGANSEAGWGIYTASGTTLTRNVYRSTGAGNNTPISLSGSAQVFITGLAEDFALLAAYGHGQHVMVGGGNITWTSSRLSWSQRLLAIPLTNVASSSRYIEITQPSVDIPEAQVFDGTASARSVAGGVLLNNWEALYAVHTPGGNHTAVAFYIVGISENFTIPSHWILVATVNGDTAGLKLGTGEFLFAGQTITGGRRSVALRGDTMTGLLTLSADPTAALHAVTKQYADANVGGVADQDYAVPAWGVDLDFTTGVYYVEPTNAANPITVSRASVGYIDTVAGVWSSVAANTLRRSNKGALIEETRTNGVRNNSMQGAVAGSPGTLPTNWGNYNGFTGLTRTVVGVGTQNGVDYIDLRLNGTTGSTGGNWAFESGTQIAGVVGDAFAVSIFLALVGGSLTNVTSADWGWYTFTSGGGFVSNNATSILGTLSSTFQRFSYASTLGGATTAFMGPRLGFGWTSGVAVDFTIRIGWPQAEKASSISSPIRTTSAAATRAADAVTLTLPPSFGSKMSMAAAATPNAPASYPSVQTLLSADDTSANNIMTLRRSTTGGASVITVGAGSLIFDGSNIAAWAQNAAGTIAGASAAASHAGNFNGGTTLTGAGAGAMPTGITTVHIGAAYNGTVLWNGYISRALIWPETRLGNTLVQSVAGTLPVAGGLVAAGEYLSASANSVALTTSVVANITSLLLGPGDWDVSGSVQFFPAGTTTTTRQFASISTTSATPATDAGAFAETRASYGAGQGAALPAGTTRINVAVATTVYLVALATFAVSTMVANGFLQARRR